LQAELQLDREMVGLRQVPPTGGLRLRLALDAEALTATKEVSYHESTPEGLGSPGRGLRAIMKKSTGARTGPSTKKASVASKVPEDWRDGMIDRLRRIIVAADPGAIEEQKWKKPSNPAGVPVWYHDGILCHVGPLKNRVRLTFLKGAALNDSKSLFNACLGACGTAPN
jgi:hypothetical protein